MQLGQGTAFCRRFHPLAAEKKGLKPKTDARSPQTTAHLVISSTLFSVVHSSVNCLFWNSLHLDVRSVLDFK